MSRQIDRSRRVWIPALLGSGLTLLALSLALWVRGSWLGDSSRPGSGPPSVAVLPLRNLSPDPADSDYLAEGITQAVVSRLAQLRLRVTPWETALRFRNTERPGNEVARELNVGTVVAGTFQLDGDRILISLSLIDAMDGSLAWSDEFEDRYDDLFDVQRRIATGVATSLKRKLTGVEQAALAEPESHSVEAYDAYLQGARLLQQGDSESTSVALEYFTRALELDPNLVDAHVGMGAAYSAREFSGWGGGLRSLDLAEASYAAALRLDPASMLARRGMVNLNHSRGLSELCLFHGQEAARLGRPDDVETLLARAQAYTFGELFDLAVPLCRRAFAIDPLSQPAYWTAVVASAFGGDFDATLELGDAYVRFFGPEDGVLTFMAIAQHMRDERERAERLYQDATANAGARPDEASTSWHTMHALLFAGAFYEQTGRPEAAEETWRTGIEIASQRLESDPDALGMRLFLAAYQGMLGNRGALEAEEARSLELAGGASPLELVYVAAARAHLGDPDGAVEVLRMALRRGRLVPWRMPIRALAPELEEYEDFGDFLAEYDALDRRLRERYGGGQPGAQ